MNKREFDYILQNGESYLVEFKERVNSSFVREMTAFANASGGRIFLGVTDSGKAVGIEITNKLRSRIQDMANNCQPPVTVVLKKYHNILIIDIPEGKDKPFQCSEGFFIRMGSNAQKMDRDRIVEFLQAEGKVRFEEQVHKKFSFKTDYSPAKLAGYLKLAGITQNLDDPSILSNLGVAEKTDDSLKMKNAGVLFFTESIQLLCEQATITCAVFDGIERVHVLNRKDYSQDIITNINNALHFIKQELRVEYKMTGTARRKEIYELPLDAVREAVINAVVHRDYFLAGSHTVIEIFDDRVEISNPGGLPRGLSERDFGRRAVRRNQLIASLLHRIDFVENMGTGINKIRTLLKVAGLPAPHFEFGDFYTIVFHRKQYMTKSVEKMSVKSSVKSSGKSSGKTADKIIKLMGENSLVTIPELAEALGVTTRAIEKQIAKLQKNGQLKRIGPAKGGYWQIINNEQWIH